MEFMNVQFSKDEIPSTPMVSIGMPVYNGGRFIRKALDSILEQTYPYFEIIISDNASTDDTGAICQEYAARDQRIRYVRQDSNIGAWNNFRYVLDAAKYDRFIWAAADDWWAEDRLDKLVSALDEQDAIVVGSIRRYANGQLYAEYTPKAFARGEWFKFLMQEESKCEKTYYIYGLMWKRCACGAFRIDKGTSGYWGDAIYAYTMLWDGNLKSVEGAHLHVNAHAYSTGTIEARSYRYSWRRLFFAVHPWNYYARCWMNTPYPSRLALGIAIPIKHIVAQLHLWSRAFRRIILRRPYVYGAVENGSRIAREAGL